MSAFFFSPNDARGLLDLLSPKINPPEKQRRKQQPLFLLAWAEGSIGAGSAIVPSYGTARLQESDTLVPVANLGDAIGHGAALLLRREQISNVFVIDGQLQNCCLLQEELPTRIIVSGLDVSGTWSALSDCCWKFTGIGYYAIDGFSAVDKCIPYQEYVRYRECYSRKHVFDFASLPVSDPGLSNTSMQVLRKLKYNLEAIQQGGMRFKIPGAKLNVYLTKSQINCSGDSGCKWIVSVEAIADGPGRHIQMSKKFTKYEVIVTEITRHPLLDTCLEPVDHEATGTFNTATSGGPCTMPQIGTPPTIRICRKKVSDTRPDSITLEHGDISACGETFCSQQGVDTFIFTGDCSSLAIGGCLNPLSPEPDLATVNWGRRHNGSRWEYNRGVGWEVYQPYSCSTPGINDCFVDCRRRHMVATDFGSPVTQLATRYWSTSYAEEEGYCNNVTVDLDEIEVEFEWPV